MTVLETIGKRRATRSFEPVSITDELIRDLAQSAGLAPSCFNNQPWRYVFVRNPEALGRMHSVLSAGNEWARSASCIIAVLGKKEADCSMKDGRIYYAFDIGLATAFLILRATELGLVAHPIAGYSPSKVREVLAVPEEMDVVALVIMGKKSAHLSPALSAQQIEAEKERPARLGPDKIVSVDQYLFL